MPRARTPDDADYGQPGYSRPFHLGHCRLRLPWLAPRVGEAVVLNGSGSYTAGDDPVSGDCTAPPYCVAQASPVAWREFRMAACVCHTGLELRTSGAQHTESPSRLFLPRLGQSAPDLQSQRRRAITKVYVNKPADVRRLSCCPGSNERSGAFYAVHTQYY